MSCINTTGCAIMQMPTDLNKRLTSIFNNQITASESKSYSGVLMKISIPSSRPSLLTRVV